MANQATFTLRSQWAWRDDTGYGPDHGAGSPNGELSETGPATAVGFDGGFPPGGIGDGGVLGNFYSATPLLFHFGITDDAPYYGDNDPGLKAMENSGSGGELGRSSASDEAAFTDYVTNTSAAPITMKFTMDVNAVVTGVGAGVGGGFSALDLNELSNTVTVSRDFNFSSGSDSVAATFTLPAGHTAVV